LQFLNIRVIRHDPIGFEGTSHFVEHLVSKNACIPCEDIYHFFEDQGGEVFLGTTNYSDTQYSFTIPAKKQILSEAFSLFHSFLFSAKLEKQIEHERRIILSEFDQYYPLNHGLFLAQHKKEMLYSDSWFGRFLCPMGDQHSLKRIQEKELQEYYDTYYTPANMSIVGVGGMRLSELVKLLSESPLMEKKSGVRTELPIPSTDVAFPLENRYILRVSKYYTERTNLGGYESTARIPGNVSEYVVDVLNEMVRKVLNQEIREKRSWTYDIGSTQEDYRDFYEFQIHCDTFVPNAIDGIEKVIEECIDSIDGREQLFEQVKRRMIAKNLVCDFTAKRICSGAMYDLSRRRRIVSFQEMNENIARVTMNDIRRALVYLQPGRRWTLLVRP